VSWPEHGPDLSDVESELDVLLSKGLSRTRATEIVIDRVAGRVGEPATVVLVEGLSDQIALDVLAARLGRNLRGEGIAIVPMGGANNLRHFLALFGPRGKSTRLAGLYDSAEQRRVRRELEHAGLASSRDPVGLEAFGFYACVTDLEDELIRSLGPAGVELVIDAQGELASLRRMQNEPFHQERTPTQHLHRFLGAHSGRKYRYARALVTALDLTKIPAPLAALLARV